MPYDIHLVDDEGASLSYVGSFEGKLPAWLRKLDGKPVPDSLPDSEVGSKLATSASDLRGRPATVKVT